MNRRHLTVLFASAAVLIPTLTTTSASHAEERGESRRATLLNLTRSVEVTSDLATQEESSEELGIFDPTVGIGDTRGRWTTNVRFPEDGGVLVSASGQFEADPADAGERFATARAALVVTFEIIDEPMQFTISGSASGESLPPGGSCSVDMLGPLTEIRLDSCENPDLSFSDIGTLAPGQHRLSVSGRASVTSSGGATSTALTFEFRLGNISCDVEGTDGPDVLGGTAGDDLICGFGGDDDIEGGGGNDTILGGPGADKLRGDDGKDRVFGGSGADRVEGGAGDDTLFGCGDDDQLYGEAGNDSIVGANPDSDVGVLIELGVDLDPVAIACTTGTPDTGDLEVGGAGDDALGLGGDLGGDDILGGPGDDSVGGGPGNDEIHGGSGTDDVDGGPGLDSIAGCGGADVIGGQAGRDRISGDSVNVSDDDVAAALLGSPPSAEVDCQESDAPDGADNIEGGPGADLVVAGGGNDRAEGGAGDDLLKGEAGNDSLVGGQGRDKLRGDGGRDRLVGSQGRDVHLGGADGDTIIATDGAPDRVDGGPGRDRAATDPVDQIQRIEVILRVR